MEHVFATSFFLFLWYYKYFWKIFVFRMLMFFELKMSKKKKSEFYFTSVFMKLLVYLLKMASSVVWWYKMWAYILLQLRAVAVHGTAFDWLLTSSNFWNAACKWIACATYHLVSRIFLVPYSQFCQQVCGLLMFLPKRHRAIYIRCQHFCKRIDKIELRRLITFQRLRLNFYPYGVLGVVYS